MTLLQLRGHITRQGRLEIDLSEGLPAGEVQVTIEFTDVKQPADQP